jgi:hypothetical protein
MLCAQCDNERLEKPATRCAQINFNPLAVAGDVFEIVRPEISEQVKAQLDESGKGYHRS